jgi:L-alanine-DL-glutamate epimerase-like enolase superfamily enzyme
MRIADIRATPVTVPLEAPLRHANGCHWGRFVRTIAEVETDDGLVGLGARDGAPGHAGVPGLRDATSAGTACRGRSSVPSSIHEALS